MDAGSSGTRQSGITSASNPHPNRFDHHHRGNSFDSRPYREKPASMATATLMTPNTPYHPHHAPSFSPGYHSGPLSNMPGMISPVESRRTSDDNEPPPHRQSLPSIKDVIGQKPPPFPSAGSSSMAAAQSLPSPFSTSTPTRPFSDAGGEKHPSPRTLHPTSSFPRNESLPAFSDPARPPVSRGPPPPPLSTFPGPPHLSPPFKPEQQHQHQPSQAHEGDQRQPEGQHLNGSFSHPPPQPHQPPQVSYQPGQLPPGQLPLSGPYPISPRHAPSGPSLPSPFDARRPPPHPDDPEFGRMRDNSKYEATLNRHFEAWSYAENLARIGSCARTLFNFAEAYGMVAREEQGNHPIPTRLPPEREVNEMMNTVDWAKTMLEQVRVVCQQSAMSERVKEGTRPKPSFEDEDIAMYDANGMKNSYDMAAVKKRRGRAAPPGRCHSCNRIDTPEWRRGPDGARTLCNACGLHYAKLERKRQSEGRSIRPKPSEERN